MNFDLSNWRSRRDHLIADDPPEVADAHVLLDGELERAYLAEKQRADEAEREARAKNSLALGWKQLCQRLNGQINQQVVIAVQTVGRN